jgi:site-specific recombinase XerD
MATSFKVKFRPSLVDGKEGSLYFQVIHNRVIRQLNTSYRVYGSEWDTLCGMVILPHQNSDRADRLRSINDSLRWDLQRLRQITDSLTSQHGDCSADDIISTFQRQSADNSLQAFMLRAISRLNRLGRRGTAEGYRAALNSFLKFCSEQDVKLDAIDGDLIQLYEAYLRQQGVCRNTSSFYMRHLRTVYNQAVAQRLTPQRFPFSHVYTGVDKTVKRAITAAQMRRLKNADLSDNPRQALARDLFLFSFYTRGMSFVDMAYLTTDNLRNGRLVYTRQKTRQQLTVKWEPEMQKIVDRYAPFCRSPYLLPIITGDDDTRRQYKLMEHRTNYSLKNLSRALRFPYPLTTYAARHSWASIARSKNVSISVISEGLGHDSERTTEIYLASIDTAQVDRANRKILRGL